MLYKLVQKALFAADPELAHDLALQSLRLGHELGGTRWLCSGPPLPLRRMGLDFANPVGLAAGMDKNADYFEAIGDLGFGFVEVGTVTPRPQPGNPRPRVFRVPQAQALINRLGFNNKGVDYLVKRVREHRFAGVLGINIGKNFDTPLERAADDYVHCLEKVHAHADYVTINISSPNTANLRDLQGSESLDRLLGQLEACRERLAQEQGRRVPMAVKVAPDLEIGAIDDICQLVLKYRVDAVIATNTTIRRPGIEGLEHAGEAGGLSGRPLKPLADEVLKSFRQRLGADLCLIGVGGICCGQDAVAKLDLGADLVQVYTGLVYQGPSLVRECLTAIARHAQP
jgi:dihydroorotate dehydrogenase